VGSVNKNNNGPMLNAYPDGLGGNLRDIANFLSKNELKDVNNAKIKAVEDINSSYQAI